MKDITAIPEEHERKGSCRQMDFCRCHDSVLLTFAFMLLYVNSSSQGYVILLLDFP